jgi:hypothetical protein
MEVVRNTQRNLELPEGAHSALDATFEQFRQVTQHVADTGWNDDPTKIEDINNTLHKPIQKDGSRQVCKPGPKCPRPCHDALGSCKDRILKDGKRASKSGVSRRRCRVQRAHCTIRYDNDHVTLATVGDRVRAEFIMPKDDNRNTVRGVLDARVWNASHARQA